MRRTILITIVAVAAGATSGWLASSAAISKRVTFAPPSICALSPSSSAAASPQNRDRLLSAAIHDSIDCFALNVPSGSSLVDGESFESALAVLSDCPKAQGEPNLTPISAAGPDFEAWWVDGRACGGSLPLSGLLAKPSDIPEPLPIVIAVHGTAASPELLFGLEDPQAFEAEEYHNELGLKLLNEGYAVFAPRIVTDRSLDPVSGFNGTRNQLDRRARSIGLTLIGLELTSLKDALTQISQLDWVSDSKVGSYGVSLGGSIAMYHAALDPRVDAVVVSQWFEDRHEKLVGRQPDALWRFEDADYAILPILPDFDDVSVAGLIAPRAIFIEAGTKDTTRTQRALALWPALENEYINAPPNSVCFEVTPGGHEVWFDGSRRFLAYWLKPRTGLEDPCPKP